MSLSSALNAARSGLQVSSLRAETVAANVSNATTPGYVRRSITLSENLLGGASSGVRSDGVTRVNDTAIKAQRRELTSDVAQASVLASTWKSISTRIGDTAAGDGLFKTFSDFETAFSRAISTPESTSAAAGLLQAARDITDELNSLSDMITTQRAEADREIANGVDVVNSALKQIEDINSRLSSMNRTSGEAAALMDERQRALDTVAEFLPIQTVERDHGTIDVLTTEGVFLLAGRARELQFAPSAAFGPNERLADGDLSGLTVDGITLTPGAASFGAVSGGLFGALFTLRDQDLPALSEQLDTIASQLISRLSNDTIDPTKTPGDPGLFIDTNTTGGAGLAGRISINAAVDPGQGGALWRLRDGIGAAAPGAPGNQTILRGMFEAFTAVQTVGAPGFQGTFSATEMAAQIASYAGQARVYNESILSSTETQYNILLEAEQSETGVDIDSQLQDLMLIEQAYAANARVIEIAGQMINRLLEL